MTGPPVPALDPDDDGLAIGRSLEQPELFARLYDRYAPDIHRYAARRLGTDAADDITAETFLTAFRVRGRYDTARASARPWLYGIAAHLIGKQRRKEVRGLRALARTGQDPVAAGWVEDTAERIADRAPLADALASLSAADRHVLLLVAWADLTYQEVAEALGIPVGTVRSRLNRARRKVRAALGPDPVFMSEMAEVAGP
ncbi:RNA polymerase sigma factor [Streptomyces sp. VRA16 Mangrove soil]|uniref:RNA polymerase sigma factor n=1 Tax=Streptomyces sp. VRA16 Mangrove soil TaxID=2817434 RepID=UPI001A9CEDAA|nr:sigma-70 family RNA polymerase sigma factor [Streptomyces sp. VRA16 Mangrove soil]MBO1335292.1 sigma-70 family RNA polymerase sigma factor [Streptomyces sp. VRA16 Mangrove soil]